MSGSRCSSGPSSGPRRLLLVHSDLRAGGGAEVYARAILDWLHRNDHAVDLLDIHGLRRASPGSGPGSATPLALSPSTRALLATGQLPGLRRRHLLRYGLVCRALPRIARDYGAVILSYGEGPVLPCPSLTLRHAPALFSTDPALLAVLGRYSPARGPYTRLCRALAGVVPPPLPSRAQDLQIANSNWTAARVAAQGLPIPKVLYPPVPPLPSLPHSPPRDPHLILCLGRIVPGKRIEEAVAILGHLRRQGRPVRLVLAGRADTPYARRLLRRLADHPDLELAPNAPDARLRDLLARASYGLHCYRHEHFGIAVAEMIQAGVLPVVHDGGGVAELVPEPALRFDDPQQAAAHLTALMDLHPASRTALLARLKRGKPLQKALNFDRQLTAILAPFLASIQAIPLATLPRRPTP